MDKGFNMRLLFIIAFSFISNIVIASDSNSKPWVIHRKEDQTAQKQVQQKNQDMQDLFELMHPESQLKQKCLAKKDRSSYHCGHIAAMLYCAKKEKTPEHKAFCLHQRVHPVGEKDFWSESYHTSNLAEEHNLTPQQTTKEIKWFIEVVKELSK